MVDFAIIWCISGILEMVNLGGWGFNIFKDAVPPRPFFIYYEGLQKFKTPTNYIKKLDVVQFKLFIWDL